MTLEDFIDQTHVRFRDAPLSTAVSSTLADAAFGVQRRITTSTGLETSIWDRDWDILCVLDACRVDLMAQAADQTEWLPDKFDTIWSVGSASPEWVGKTFHPKHAEEMASTAYLTANPFSAKPGERAAAAPEASLPLRDRDFAVLDEVWKTEWSDGELSVVHPRILTDRAIDVWRRREELGVERMVIHYMQPHIPFRSRPEWFNAREDLGVFGEPSKEGGKDPWKEVRDGHIPRDEFWDAYLDNLHWVLDDVNLLRRNASGEIVLSSDHGNAMGEFGIWSHPAGIQHPQLRRVPWVEIDGLDTGSHEPVESGAVSRETTTEEVNERLRMLGYQ